jgi:hypothetical protein
MRSANCFGCLDQSTDERGDRRCYEAVDSGSRESV